MCAARRLCVILLLVIAGTAPDAVVGAGPARASVREYRKVIRTYPFSDPNPIASPGRIYPYFRFDGFTDQATAREWTVIELENEYLKVTVLPEIGGKIWSAVEKSTGRSFIYDNHVVKFRDIAMRGPWTSGGIEPNYGIIGHTPNCATPVDYLARTEPDGSAVVIIGVLDLLTRTPWRLEIRVPADKAYFTTRSFWFNATPLEQPYYTWMNAGVKAAGNLELIYPGTSHIGHSGEVSPWPIHPGNGKNLAFYDQNDFGPSKSYHVLGRHSDFFGAYWHDDDFGMAHYATRDDKVGKKAWIWGLSRQGMIWERLLTDTDGQYVEVQSGRLFNQADEGSTLTPFKHRGFEPYSADTWTEYWFPVKATKGFVRANEYGALNVTAEASRLVIRFSPVQSIHETLEVFDGGRLLYSVPLALAPMQAWSGSVEGVEGDANIRVRIGDLIEYRRQAGDELSRPLESPKDFDWQSVQGLWMQGKEWMRQRDYARARASLEACLKRDPNYLPALADLAALEYRAMAYRRAWELARRGLSIDTYDAASNYYYGLASLRLGRSADAMDGFELAALSPGWRPAAWTELARVHLVLGEKARAREYAARSVASDPWDVEALQVMVVSARAQSRRTEASEALERLATLDPLSPFVAFERHLLVGDEASRRAFVAGIRNELPHETFLELAAWYYGLGRLDESRRVLRLAPGNAEVLYWLAFLEDRLGKGEGEASPPTPATVAQSGVAPERGVAPEQRGVAREQAGVARGSVLALLQQAAAASPRLVFPFRAESAEVFEWAVAHSSDWQPRYYLALIRWSLGDLDGARQLLERCGESPGFAPFYASRAKLLETVSRERSLADLRKAAVLDPREWRFGRLIADRLLEDGANAEAVQVAERYYRQFPGSSVLGMLHAKALLRAGRVSDADAALARLQVLPYEGSIEGRLLYREAKLVLAAQAWKAGNPREALHQIAAAREWPEHLGAGKPYPDVVDERLEDYLEARSRGQAPGAAFKPASAVEARILAAWE